MQTHEGIGALTDFAYNLLARQRAGEIAQAVRGVRGLHSTLTVHAAGLIPREPLAAAEIPV